MLYALLTDINTTEKINIHTNLQSVWQRNIINMLISLPLTAIKIFSWKCLKYEKIDSYNNNVERKETAYLDQFSSFHTVPIIYMA